MIDDDSYLIIPSAAQCFFSILPLCFWTIRPTPDPTIPIMMVEMPIHLINITAHYSIHIPLIVFRANTPSISHCTFVWDILYSEMGHNISLFHSMSFIGNIPIKYFHSSDDRRAVPGDPAAASKARERIILKAQQGLQTNAERWNYVGNLGLMFDR